MTLPLANGLRRRALSYLAQNPPLYLRMLRWTRRGNMEKKLYLALLQHGDVVFDVGANHGYFTLLFSDLVGPDGEVHAFEPLPPTFAWLRESLRRQQQFDNVLLNNVACAEHACEIPLHMPNEDSGQASLQPQRAGSWRAAQRVSQLPVQAIRLDDYDRGAVGQHLDFVKCDVEGAELLALRGMMRKLARFRPLLLVEAFAAWTAPFGYDPAILIAFLESVGYDAFYLVRDRLTRVADACQAVAAAAARESVNVLCAHTEQHADRLRLAAAFER